MQMTELAKKDSSSLLAPSLAAAALGLFLPMLKPSAVAPVGWKQNTDKVVSAVSVVGLLAMFYFWQMLVATNLGNAVPAWLPNWNFFAWGRPATFAILLDGAAAFLAEVKALVEA